MYIINKPNYIYDLYDNSCLYNDLKMWFPSKQATRCSDRAIGKNIRQVIGLLTYMYSRASRSTLEMLDVLILVIFEYIVNKPNYTFDHIATNSK